MPNKTLYDLPKQSIWPSQERKMKMLQTAEKQTDLEVNIYFHEQKYHAVKLYGNGNKHWNNTQSFMHMVKKTAMAVLGRNTCVL